MCFNSWHVQMPSSPQGHEGWLAWLLAFRHSKALQHLLSPKEGKFSLLGKVFPNRK